MARDPSIILSDRLQLVPMPAEALRALIAGQRQEAERLMHASIPEEFPGPGDDFFFAIQMQRMQHAPDERDWLIRLMVLKDKPVAVGNIGFHGPPRIIGRAELGYTVFTAWRRQGYAREAIKAMLNWAAGQGVPSVFLSISPNNTPSLALAEQVGFHQVGIQEDEIDGTELVFELALSPLANSPSAPAGEGAGGG